LTAPNLLNISSIVAHTATTTLSSTAASAITNNAGSNTVAKMEDVILVNNNTTTTLTANVFIVRTIQAPGTYYLATNIGIPPNSTLTVIGKDTPIYLEEGDSLQGTGTTVTGTFVTMFAAYDIVST
jgi:uncharacterized protein (UPF0333 family)